MVVVSPGALPKEMTVADLGYATVRRNPLVADLLHRIYFIEKAGTGIRRMRDDARAQGCPEPELYLTGSFFRAVFRPNPAVRAAVDSPTGTVTDEVTPQVRLLRAISGEITRQQLQKTLGLNHERHFRTAWLAPALRAGLIEMTIPGKPRSRNQRYRHR